MLEAERTITVDKPQTEVWDFVADMNNWARQMPGYVTHQQLDDTTSEWTVQVNLGPFQRSVVIDVEITKWLSPSDVLFKIKGRVEPFHGGGRFHTETVGQKTRIVLRFEAEPTGSMATMLTGLARPVLERVANEFSANLASVLCRDRSADEARSGRPVPANRSFVTLIQRLLGGWIGRLLRRGTS